MNDYKTLYRSIAHNLPISAPQEISENTGYYYEYMYNPYVDDDVLAKKVFGVGNKDNKRDYSKEYLTFEILEGSGTLSWYANESMENGWQSMFCSLNGGEWIGCTQQTEEQDIYWSIELQVKAGDIIRLKNNGSYDEYGDPNYIGCPYIIDHEDNQLPFNAYGNAMSIIYGDAFNDKFTFSDLDVIWYNQFFARSGIVDASNLILPATTLTESCYNNMFEACEHLIAAPKLPATNLANNCYSGMFMGCTSLTTAPALPAETLASYCYQNMFMGCTSLTQAPVLSATTLAVGCYSIMFSGCTSLTKAPELPATTLTDRCYEQMFCGCPITKAPDLPAQTLVERCYFEMFAECPNLNYIKCLATNISASECTYSWVYNISANDGTFIKDPSMENWTHGHNGIPSNWTVENAN